MKQSHFKGNGAGYGCLIHLSGVLVYSQKWFAGGIAKVTEVEYCLGIPDPAQRKAVISALSPAGLHCMGEGRIALNFGVERKGAYKGRNLTPGG